MEINDSFEYEFSFTQNDVNEFANVTGDMNPIHIDDEFARQSLFKRRIIHGFLSGSVFSKVFGTIWPGNGTIYLNQQMTFLQPMYTEVNYLAKFSIIECLPKNKFWVKTIVINPEKEMTIDGIALIKI